MLDQSQLPLDIHLRDDAVFTSFYPGVNREAFFAIQKLVSEKAKTGTEADIETPIKINPEIKKNINKEIEAETFIYLWGTNGVGKSHLLQAICHEAYEAGLPAVYIPLKNCRNMSVNMLDDLEKMSLICLDDIHCVAQNPIWEEALFHLYNRIRERKIAADNAAHNKGSYQKDIHSVSVNQEKSLPFQNTCRLLVSAEKSPLHIHLQLADLKSRLASGVTYQLHLMSDEEKIEALRLRAHCRGLELNKTVAQFLLNHCPRNMQELFGTLEKLDQASLAEQRRLTIPFVKQILGASLNK